MISEGPSVLRLARFTNGNPFKPTDLADEGLPVVRIRQLLDPSARFDRAAPPARPVIIDRGDLIFSWSATLAVRHWQGGKALLNQHLFRVDPYPGIERRWLGYVLTVGIDRLVPLMHGSAMTHITLDMLRMLSVAVPSRDTQEEMADYLDAESVRVDSAIVRKNRMIELLPSRLISLAADITVGRYGGLKTGIPTLPEVPASWRVLRNKVFMQEVNRRSPDGKGDMLSVSHITGVTPRSEKTVYMFEAESTVGYKMVRPGDLVINTMWAWMGAAGVAWTAGIVSPAYGVYTIDKTIMLPEFFDVLIRTPAYITEMTRFSRGVTSSRLRLYPDEFLRLSSPVPPIEEQREIAEHYRSSSSNTRAVCDHLARQVDLLRDRRQALITAVVTGELDIPEVTA